MHLFVPTLGSSLSLHIASCYISLINFSPKTNFVKQKYYKKMSNRKITEKNAERDANYYTFSVKKP